MVLFILTANVHGIPLLEEPDFENQISGYSTQVENFESFSLGFKEGSVFTFLNGTYTDLAGGAVIEDDPQFCGSFPDQCLTNQIIPTGKKIDGLPASTTFFSVHMNYIRASDPFEVIVTGGSGVSTFNETGRLFFGFHDPLGLTSVFFENLGQYLGPELGIGFGNFSFDDVTTAQKPSSVPEPPTSVLLMIGLLGLLVTRRLRGK
jgi:hypothetical protein